MSNDRMFWVGAAALVAMGLAAAGMLREQSETADAQAREASVAAQVSTLTCWSPDGKVILSESGIRASDIEMRVHSVRVFRGGAIAASLFHAVPCALMPEAARPGR